MNNKDVLDFVNGILNKDQAGRVISPDRFNTLLKTASIRQFKRKMGLPEEYRPGQPIPRDYYEVNKRSTESLRRFKKIMGEGISGQMIISKYGYSDLPSDYFIVRYVNYVNDGVIREVKIVEDKEYNECMSDSITFPTLRNPIINLEDERVKLRPLGMQFVNFAYFRLPLTPVYDYYIDNSTLEEVYLEVGQTPPEIKVTYSGYSSAADNRSVSVELEWNDVDKMDIAMIILSDMGVNIRAQEVVQYAEMVKAKGV